MREALVSDHKKELGVRPFQQPEEDVYEEKSSDQPGPAETERGHREESIGSTEEPRDHRFSSRRRMGAGTRWQSQRKLGKFRG